MNMKDKRQFFDIAIYGGTMSNNFGGVLTYYALYKALCEIGMSVVIIPPNPDKHGVVMKDNVFHKHCNIAPNFHKNGRQGEFNDLSDSFIVGSDQMWNCKLFGEWGLNPFLDFIYDEKRKYAYSVSMGNYDLTKNEKRNEINRLLKRFDAISVREPYAQRILKENFDISSEVLIDPVFLCDNIVYEDLINECNIDCGGEYAFIYDLGLNKKHIECIQEVNDSLGIKEKIVQTGNFLKIKESELCDKNLQNVLSGVSVNEWLKLIKNAKYVITNSFHGICFSILFKKNFVVMGGIDERKMNILQICELLDRVAVSNTSNEVINILSKPINYKDVFTNLFPHIEKGKEFIFKIKS